MEVTWKTWQKGFLFVVLGMAEDTELILAARTELFHFISKDHQTELFSSPSGHDGHDGHGHTDPALPRVAS